MTPAEHREEEARFGRIRGELTSDPDDPRTGWDQGEWYEETQRLERALLRTADDKRVLVEALERLLRNSELAFERIPVRDWDETLSKARAALDSVQEGER